MIDFVAIETVPRIDGHWLTPRDLLITNTSNAYEKPITFLVIQDFHEVSASLWKAYVKNTSIWASLYILPPPPLVLNKPLL